MRRGLRNTTLLISAWIVLFAPCKASATTLTFEDLPDLTDVNDFYAAQGIHFANAISLTAGFSLNEFDYPPSSGVVVVGDSGGPLRLVFDAPANNVFAHFTHGSALTFTAYSDKSFLSPIGTFSPVGNSNLGASTLINVPFANFESLQMSVAIQGTLTIDDLNFRLSPNGASVPEPSTLLLLSSGVFVTLRGLRQRAAR
jgi:hypothetical protein